jgi:hypothetical protein
MVVLSVTTEEGHEILHAQLAHRLAAFNRSISECAFCFLKVKNTFFDRARNGEAIYNNVDCLIQAMDTVYSLFLYKLVIVSFRPRIRHS